MGRSRSRDRDRRRGRSRSRDRRRSRSRDRYSRRSRSTERRRRRSRSSSARRRDRNRHAGERPNPMQRVYSKEHRFDSPPRNDEAEKEKANALAAVIGLGAIAQAAPVTAALTLPKNVPFPAAANLDQTQKALSHAEIQARNMTRVARQLYIGNLPGGIQVPQIVAFLNEMMLALNLNTQAGAPVIGGRISLGGFGFVEFRSMEEATNGMKLNGCDFLGCTLKINRPKHYVDQASGAANPNDTAAQTSKMLAIASGEQMPEKYCLCHIPVTVTEEKARSLLTAFGELRQFQLIVNDEGVSSGCATFEFMQYSSEKTAKRALVDIKIGDRKLEICKPEEAITKGYLKMDGGAGLNKPILPSRCLFLANIVQPADLEDDQEYDEIFEDIKIEASNYGEVEDVKIPREGDGMGFVFIQMDHIESASRVKKNLSGRKFGEHEVEVNYFSEKMFENGELADPTPNTDSAEVREYKPKREYVFFLF